MKKLLSVAVVLAAIGTLWAAEGPQIAITSFIWTGQNTRTAELCGKVTGADSQFTVARVTVDPQSRRPGLYNALVGKDGNFCTVVATYYGTAKASVEVLGKTVESNTVLAVAKAR